MKPRDRLRDLRLVAAADQMRERRARIGTREHDDRVRIERFGDEGRFRLVRAFGGKPLELGSFVSERWARIGAREHGLRVVS